ncbi:MAG: DUF362 domain-containing protein [Chloroflexi bacterium]|nr:DUF362 domain-containing protein [Chloroflexota bacterium]
MDWDRFLADVELPRMYRVRQNFPSRAAVDVRAEIDAGFANPAIARCVRPEMRVAIAVGSRGVANLATAVRGVVDNLRAAGAVPFIVPAMGSHGAATAAGQTAVLASLGVDEARMGAPVVSSLDTMDIGPSPSGWPVHCDAVAAHADALIAINRIKPHTGFQGRCESGLCKLLSIGLGNETGAGAAHAFGMDAFADLIPDVGSYVARKLHLIVGVGLVENYLHQTVRVAFVQPEELVEREAHLLQEARALMGRILLPKLHVLVVREIGKDVSGEGMDPNVTGRYVTSRAVPQISIQKIVVLDLSPGTGRNANGIGLADITTRRLAELADYAPMYVNALTARYCEHVKMPLTMETERDAIKAAVRSLWGLAQPEDIELAVVKNTLELNEILISNALLPEAASQPRMCVTEGPFELRFDAEGRLE